MQGNGPRSTASTPPVQHAETCRASRVAAHWMSDWTAGGGVDGAGEVGVVVVFGTGTGGV